MGYPMGTGTNGLNAPRQNLTPPPPLIRGFILPEDSAYVVFCWQDVTLCSFDVSARRDQFQLSH